MKDVTEESTSTVEAWLGRRRPRYDAARLMTGEPIDGRDDETDIALRDLVLKPLTHFDRHLHPVAQISELGYDWFKPTPPDLFRIFGPAGTGATPDKKRHYGYEWRYTDPIGHVQVYARPKLDAGRFAAGHSLTNGYGQALAALGVVIVPSLPWCKLSVRPYVNYQGSFYLSGRRPPDAWENASSTAWASVGILVESWSVGGGFYHLDIDQPVVVSTFSETNPTKSWRDFGGSISGSAGLTTEVFASSSRRYRIWVYCWAEVQAQSLISAGAYASASIDCWMPYLVVEQIKL